MSDQAPSTTKSAAQMLKEAAAAKATAPAVAQKSAEPEAKLPEEIPAEAPEVLEDSFPQRYQLPSAPCTLTFRDKETNVVYRRIFPDGVAKAETLAEHLKLEGMVRTGTCHYYQGLKFQTRSQRPPAPLGPDTHEVY